MSNEPNPYESPIAAEHRVLEARLVTGGPKGFPGPLVLAWIGVVLAAGIIVSLFSQIGMIAGSAVLAVPPFRIAWVIYTTIQRRRHSAAWQSGPRAFLQTVWIINVVLLVIDAAIILLLATCFALIDFSTIH